ncbi:sigma-70 family RNA polymerase sigma factor [Paenisporosarcina sp.]|uniref:sigma-70 family RNA polymerase sigma factor n=1 Tax=Paenisporosarcina sp. TaxID=1932001 RepID=UPI003C753FB7
MKELFDHHTQSVEIYLDKLKKHLQNPIIKSFLEIPEHVALLKEVRNQPTPELKKKLDDTFREFYFNIRFTTYLSQTIYFNAINYDKKIKLVSERYQLILDRPLKDDGELTFLDLLSSSENMRNTDIFIDSSTIMDHLTSYDIFHAIQSLTENQQQVLSLAYIYGLNDSEIASSLNKSQQAVSKSHTKALRKIREIIETEQRRKGQK